MMRATQQDETMVSFDESGAVGCSDGRGENFALKTDLNEHVDAADSFPDEKDKDFSYAYRAAKDSGVSHDSACFIASESAAVRKKSSDIIGESNVSRHIDSIFVIGIVDSYIGAFAAAKKFGADDEAAAKSADGVVVGCHSTYANATRAFNDGKTTAERKTIKTAAAAAALAVARGYVDSWGKAFGVATGVGDDLACAMAFADSVAADYHVDHDEAAKVDNCTDAIAFADGAAEIHGIVYGTSRGNGVDPALARGADSMAASERRDAYINARNKYFSHDEAFTFANETAKKWNSVYNEARNSEGDRRAILIASSKLPHI
jgi:hypothetical protein